MHFISSSINLFFLMSAAAFIKLQFFSNFSPLYKETKQKQIFNHDMHFLHWYGFLFRKYPQISRKISWKYFHEIPFYFEGGVFPNRFLDTEAPLGVVGWADLVCPWDLNLKKYILNLCIRFFLWNQSFKNITFWMDYPSFQIEWRFCDLLDFRRLLDWLKS